MKLCKKCQVQQELSQFRKTQEWYRNSCLSCELKYDREYKAKNLEKVRQSRALSARNNRATSRAWAHKNVPKLAAKNRKRELSKIQRTPTWLSKKDLKEIEQFYIKAHEMTKLYNKKYEVDHIIPLKGKEVSGLHVPWNLQIMDKIQNIKKSNKLGGY